MNVAKFNRNLKKIKGTKIRDGLKLKSIRLMPYAKYVENLKKYGGGDLENFLISPKRQIFLMELHAANGLEIPNRGRGIIQDEPKPLKFQKAKLFMVFDAETGEYFGSNIFEVASFEEPK